jgi:MFS family permease
MPFAILLLAAGQTLIWAAVYYSFAALMPAWLAETGWSEAELALGLSLALLVAAALAPLTGRLIDSGRGPALLWGGALAGSALVASLALVERLEIFLLVWTAIGATQAACLYEPCFAFVTRRLGAGARGAITQITLVAGFASALAFPLGAWSAAALGWRGAVLVFAACGVAGALCLRLGAARLVATTTAQPESAESARRDEDAARRALRAPAFWLLAVSLPLMALNHGALINLMLPLLGERGLAPGVAVLVASLIGPMQVAGRLVLMGLGGARQAAALMVFAFLCVAAAALALGASGPGALWLAFLFAGLQGAGYGVTSILRPAATVELLGPHGFGRISGGWPCPIWPRPPSPPSPAPRWSRPRAMTR